MEGVGLLARRVVRADGAGPSEGGGIVMTGEGSFLGPLGTAEVDRSNIQRWPFSSRTAGSIDS